MARYERGLGHPGHIYCIPEYTPHNHHAHSILEHGNTVDCYFFAVLEGSHSGIYSDLYVVFTLRPRNPR
jgi:hypothetical protein